MCVPTANPLSKAYAAPAGASPIVFDANAYEFIAGAFSFDQANAAAQAQTFNGASGHLVTIMSATENVFVLGLISSIEHSVWIGATDRDVEGVWRWVTGEQSWQGGAAGTPVPTCSMRIGALVSQMISARVKTSPPSSVWLFPDSRGVGTTVVAPPVSEGKSSSETAMSSNSIAPLPQYPNQFHCSWSFWPRRDCDPALPEGNYEVYIANPTNHLNPGLH
jgi:hypothetical protein